MISALIRSLAARGAGGPAATIRPLTLADADCCARLHATGFARGWSAAEFAELLRGRGASGAAATLRKGLTRTSFAGFVVARAALDEAEILTLIVDRAARRRGLGRDLMLDQLGRLAAEGVRSVTLEVDEANVAARRLYESLGFRTVGARPAYYAGPDGTRSGALVMKVTP